MSEEDEKKYILAWSNGDEAAREKLIEHNLRLAAHIAKKYSHGIDTDDFISIGTIGLIKGVNTFDTSKGKLSSYLSKCVENEILMYLRATKKQIAEVSLGRISRRGQRWKQHLPTRYSCKRIYLNRG